LRNGKPLGQYYGDEIQLFMKQQKKHFSENIYRDNESILSRQISFFETLNDMRKLVSLAMIHLQIRLIIRKLILNKKLIHLNSLSLKHLMEMKKFQ
jgi:hypothetical protein